LFIVLMWCFDEIYPRLEWLEEILQAYQLDRTNLQTY
jgi:hypothetical protein